MLNISATGTIADVIRAARDIPQRVIPYAAAAALTKAAKAGQLAIRAEMPSAFDRPTPYILAAHKIRTASKDDLRAEVAIKESPGSRGEATLLPQVFGGARKQKAFENALRFAGVLPRGWFAVSAANSEGLNAYGNIPGPLMNQILAYFGGFSEQGYLANMTDKRRKRLARVKRTAGGYKTITGKRYFFIRPDMPNYGRQGLQQPGIYSATGIHGIDVKPVVVFVKSVSYKPRLPFHATVQRAAETTFPAAFAETAAAILARNPQKT